MDGGAKNNMTQLYSKLAIVFDIDRLDLCAWLEYDNNKHCYANVYTKV